MSEEKTIPDHLADVRELLTSQRQRDELAPGAEGARYDADDENVQDPSPVELRSLLERIPLTEVAAIIEALEPEERMRVWDEVREDRGESILEILSDEIREDLVCDTHLRNEKTSVTAFELRNGRLSQIVVHTPYDLRCLKPIWVDLVAPTPEIRAWVGRHFGISYRIRIR